MPEISDCEVITVPDEQVVNRAVAFVVVNNGVLPTEDLRKKIITYCQMIVPEYMVPTEIIYLDEIPLNSTKKHDLKQLGLLYNENNDNSIKKKIKK